MTKPAVFMLEPIGVDGALEANGTVFTFCCEECRETALIERRVESDGPIATGDYSDWCDGAVCDECRKPL